MFIAIASIVLLVLGVGTVFFNKGLPGLSKVNGTTIGKIIGISCLFLGLMGFFSRSFLIIDSDEIGHLKKIYLGSDLPAGKIIATDGQKGPQAQILGPGFHFMFLVNVLYDAEMHDVVVIPDGSYGELIALDGAPLRPGQFIADEWPTGEFENMMDAEFFLTEGKGQKGPQLTVLSPGKYRINRFLFDVKVHKALDVPAGHVAVIRSNVATHGHDCPDVIKTAGGSPNANVATPIVPVGCIGVWNEPKPPGKYYLNQKAYVPTIIPTRIQTWTYKGGYTERAVKLALNDDGSIQQKFTEKEIPTPESAADKAINVRVEGWVVPVDARILVSVEPKFAPTVVATVGDLKAVEDKIITPAIRDIMRTIGGHPDRKALDFIEKRDELAKLVEDAIIKEGRKAGVTIQEVRLGEPSIPPELMVARLREQLANQLKKTYLEEQKTQNERIKVERERASANQQSVLVAAEIAKQAAEYRKEQLKLEGEGEKLRLMEIAQGQQAQSKVLGQDRVLQLQMLKEILQVAKDNPEIIKVPTVQVSGSGSSLEGAAAVLGASNFGQMMKSTNEKKK
ncbi:MAG: hypothetical protein HWE13_04620 [Gammaproteobacteria bacterium]|nr:hypothetical protein [Gammaproteobacteria bacterium]NVK87382.1 hypothetical protein [Gammaproteobacteria bacterium]